MLLIEVSLLVPGIFSCFPFIVALCNQFRVNESLLSGCLLVHFCDDILVLLWSEMRFAILFVNCALLIAATLRIVHLLLNYCLVLFHMFCVLHCLSLHEARLVFDIFVESLFLVLPLFFECLKILLMTFES